MSVSQCEVSVDMAKRTTTAAPPAKAPAEAPAKKKKVKKTEEASAGGKKSSPLKLLMQDFVLPNKEKVPGILRGTIYPVLRYLYTKEGIRSRTDMLKRFNEIAGTGTSMQTFAKWCNELGLKFRVTATVQGMEDTSVAAVEAEDEEEEVEEVVAPTKPGKKSKPAPAPVVEEEDDEEEEEDDDLEDDLDDIEDDEDE